ncbi:Monocarboxylate transporter 2 [Holothuria leucospilota]|uniref:Monocarboxylate transporter 2 n=1 Tax=Holothuria leucospilota TaxID=206669 RepID=A0A9Q0YD42_HOLLE|nr:Monocarboxylate transporter 2 [Holothuria leucospilota]
MMGKWILVVTLCMRLFIFSGSVKSNGVILDKLVQQLDTSHSLVAWAFALQNAVAMLLCKYFHRYYFCPAPFTLILLRVFSNRQLCIVGGVLCGAGYVYCGLFLNSVWQVFVGFIVSSIGFTFSGLPAFFVLQQYFSPEDLPKIISVTVLCDYLGVAALPPVLQYFLNQYGLKNSLLLFGALVLNVIACGVASKVPRSLRKSKLQATKTEKRKEEENISKKRKLIRSFTEVFDFVSTLFQHKNIVTLIVLEFVAYYVFISWALFLVSLGKSLGLSPTEAVLLSTGGGIGGFVGRLIAVFLFQYQKMNAFSSSLLPNLITGISLLVITFQSNFYIIMFLSFLSGLSQGINISGIYGLVPTIVCFHHYKCAICFENTFGGIAVQFSGLLSGKLRHHLEVLTSKLRNPVDQVYEFRYPSASKGICISNRSLPELEFILL